MKTPKGYRCQYRFYSPYAGAWVHQWEMVGARQAINLHITVHPDANEDSLLSKPSGGIEVHYRNPPDERMDDPPDHDVCQLLHSPCWHDGTSLGARQFIDELQRCWNVGGLHEKFFCTLAIEYGEDDGDDD